MLSDKQQQIANYIGGLTVVKACPGSGKTHSVSVLISNLIKRPDLNNQGIAAISFTNAATDEIKKKLSNFTGMRGNLNYPHFLGTVDKFVNNYIFLPHGHLYMGCNKRPELVGAPHKAWTKGKGSKNYVRIPGRRELMVTSVDPNHYFDMTTFDINDKLVPLAPASEYHFSFKKYYNNDGSVFKKIQDIINAKCDNFQLGYANQADANYIALQILGKFPLIAKAIAGKFKYLIVDEAQDTDDVQMSIIEHLREAGVKNILLIGDPDQSIYEWNNADPNLFNEKYDERSKISLDENWRSSQHICNFTRPLSSFERVRAVSSVSQFECSPVIRGYEFNNVSALNPILTEFFATCEQNGIAMNQENVAVLYRGKSMRKYLFLPVENEEEYPWLPHQYHVKDIVLGKRLFEIGQCKKGYQILEKAYFEAVHKAQTPDYYCSANLLQSYILENGFIRHRSKVSKFMSTLPSTINKQLDQWIRETNRLLNQSGFQFSLNVKVPNARLPIDAYFPKEMSTQTEFPFYHGTIHSVKGKTFDAVFLFLGKKAGTHSHYVTILREGPKEAETEELRLVYVALTRPRKVLFLVTPNEDAQEWAAKLVK